MRCCRTCVLRYGLWCGQTIMQPGARDIHHRLRQSSKLILIQSQHYVANKPKREV